MNSLEFAAREKVNQLAVLANFSSWRSEQAHDVCACLPAYLLRTGNHASSHVDYARAKRLIENRPANDFWGTAFLFRAGEHQAGRDPPFLLNAESERLVMNDGGLLFR